jgi:aminoglycoside phosphotransferase (APT) family kinase protein
VFVKAAGSDPNAMAPAMHRREGEILAVLPEAAPAPRLIGVVDDGDWVAVVVEWVHGHMPVAPLSGSDVRRLLRVVDRVGQVDGVDGLDPCAAAHDGLFGHWQRLRSEPLDGVDAWTVAHLDRLVALETAAPEAVTGEHLVHFDLRTDNVVFSELGDHHDVVVDWPHAAIGAPWADLAGLLPSLELDGGPAPHEVFDEHPLGRDAPAECVDAFIAAIAGYFVRMSLQPAPPGLPTLRAFQAAQGAVTLRWLAHRRRWQRPGSTAM